MRRVLRDGPRLFIDNKVKILVPWGLDDIEVLPLWMSRITQSEYYILCGIRTTSSIPGHWVCSFTGPLTTSDRRLVILFNLDEWLDWEFPKASPKKGV